MHTTVYHLRSIQGRATRMSNPSNAVILLSFRLLIDILDPWKSTTIRVEQRLRLVICTYPTITQTAIATDLNSFTAGRMKYSRVARTCARLYSTLKPHYLTTPRPLLSQRHSKRTRASSNGWRPPVGSITYIASAWQCAA